MMTLLDFEATPSGRVLARDEQKKMRLRIIQPKKLKICELCASKIENKSGALGRGNVTLLVMCPACTIENIHPHKWGDL